MILAVAAGGAIGAVLRLVVGRGMFYLMGSEFPWGTLVVNILGSFLVGLFVEILSLRYSLSHEWQGFIIIGVFGGFTTFSAFSLEVSLMIEKGDFSNAALYGLVSMFIGVLALFIGLFAGRALV